MKRFAVFLLCAGALAAIACAPRADLADAARRECPHDWPDTLVFADPEREGATIRVPAPLNGPGPIKNVPEFHDCQRFITPQMQYDSMFAIFAVERLSHLDSLVAVYEGASEAEGLSSGSALPAAEIVAWNQYPSLGIGSGFNCLYLWPAPEGNVVGWRARMVSFGPNEQDCRQPVEHARLAGHDLDVTVHADARLPDPVHYPSVARWEWDATTRRQYIGIRCGPAWCEVGNGVASAPTYASTVPGSGSLPQDRFRVLQVKGWYDQQVLAVDAGSGGMATPSTYVGTIIPHPGLERMTEADFADWNTVAWVAIEGSGPNPYETKFNLHATVAGASFDELNRIDLCTGETCACPPGASGCVEVPTACTKHDGSPSDGVWKAMITNPVNQRSVVRCVARYAMDPTLNIPGTVRWRWLADDEGQWMRCPLGCCELGQM
jgi:hypothetical protein